VEALLFNATAAFLVVGWLAIELLMRRRAVRGTIVRALGEGGPADWLQSEWLVRTDAGRLVRAKAHGCVQCQGGLQAGGRVGLLRDRDGFVVTLTKGCGPACERREGR
jgi:hypothetical protein